MFWRLSVACNAGRWHHPVPYFSMHDGFAGFLKWNWKWRKPTWNQGISCAGSLSAGGTSRVQPSSSGNEIDHTHVRTRAHTHTGISQETGFVCMCEVPREYIRHMTSGIMHVYWLTEGKLNFPFCKSNHYVIENTLWLHWASNCSTMYKLYVPSAHVRIIVGERRKLIKAVITVDFISRVF